MHPDTPADIEQRLFCMEWELIELDRQRAYDEEAEQAYYDLMDEYGELRNRLHELKNGR